MNSYLLEITARIFQQVDEKTGAPLIDLILDQAAQNGTGMWTSEDAMDLQEPAPTIDTAVSMRDLSALRKVREECSRKLARLIQPRAVERPALIGQLRDALFAGMIITYAQGMALLAAASTRRQYQLDLAAVARIWRGGCIIRSGLLEQIGLALQARPDLPNLLADPGLAQTVLARQENLRRAVCAASELGVPAPGLMASLAYLDSCRSAWLPASLIQAQRDFFGAHTYQRTDVDGVFHTQWEKE